MVISLSFCLIPVRRHDGVGRDWGEFPFPEAHD
jgi:hypothetical protein